MTTFLSGDDLASYLGVDQTDAVDTIVRLTNKLVEEEWANPVDPVPAWVTNIAYAVAIRAASNPKGLTSQTRSWDDVTRTERWESGGTTFVDLTDAERARLNGSATGATAAVAPRSISRLVPGWDHAPGAYTWKSY